MSKDHTFTEQELKVCALYGTRELKGCFRYLNHVEDNPLKPKRHLEVRFAAKRTAATNVTYKAVKLKVSNKWARTQGYALV